MSQIDFSTHRERITSFSQAGLTDIILLLLIFFLLTSNFVTQFGIKVDVPQADAGASTSEDYITVTVTEENEFFVNRDPVSEEGLLGMLTNVKEDRTAIILRADERAAYGKVVVAMNAAQALEMRILVATEREDTGDGSASDPDGSGMNPVQMDTNN